MYFTPEIIKKNAKLARLQMTDEMAEQTLREIEGIVKWTSQIDEVNTDGVEPLYTVSEHTLPMYADTAVLGDAETIVSAAPDRVGEYIAVPKIIE